MLSDRKARVQIDLSSSGDNTVIAAPGAGKHIEIDHINILPSGGANVVILKEGSTEIVEYGLDDNQLIALDLPIHNSLQLPDNTAFVINLGSATLVSGFVIYRVVGE